MFSGCFSSSYGVVGIDIGSRSIRMLQLRAGSGANELEVVAAAEVPQEGGHLAERLKAAFNASGFAGRKCVLSLPRGDLHMQAIRLPKMSESELREAARWEAVDRFGLDPEACEVDIVRTGATIAAGDGDAGNIGTGREEVLVIAAAHSVIHARVNPIFEAGLRPSAIDTHFGALARLFSRQYRRESDRHFVRAVLEIGSTGSTILILRGDRIAFCKPITIGGDRFNEAVAEHLQLDVSAAAQLRTARTAGFAERRESGARLSSLLTPLANASPETPNPTDPSTDQAIFEAVRPVISELAKEVMLCLRHYGVTFRGKPAERLILTGGECNEPHLDEIVATCCKLPIEFDDEGATLTRIRPALRAMLHRTPGPASCWSVAAGLSIREMKGPQVEERDALRTTTPSQRASESAAEKSTVPAGLKT